MTERSVNLDCLQWSKLPVEEAYLNFVPKKNQNDSECLKAKCDELEKLKNFGKYEEVKDTGQACYSTCWILWYKGEEVRARLVACGFEEATMRSDSPIVGRSAVRMLLSIATTKEWTVKTTDIKSAFLQGQAIDRDVFLSPPSEAGSEGKLSKLKKCLYGLNGAACQFYKSVVEELKMLGCVQSVHDPALFYFLEIGGNLNEYWLVTLTTSCMLVDLFLIT